MLKEYVRRRIVITAEKVEVGTKIHNLLTDEDYVSTEELCIRLKGPISEMWLVTIPELISTYSYPDRNPIQIDSFPEREFPVRLIVEKNEKTIFAEKTKKKLKITNKYGKTIEVNKTGIPHGRGDYIIYGNNNGIPDFADRDVVNGEIFLRLYREIKPDS